MESCDKYKDIPYKYSSKDESYKSKDFGRIAINGRLRDVTVRVGNVKTMTRVRLQFLIDTGNDVAVIALRYSKFLKCFEWSEMTGHYHYSRNAIEEHERNVVRGYIDINRKRVEKFVDSFTD